LPSWSAELSGPAFCGLSVNPARSLAPAVFVGGQALAQVWLFLVVPTIAGAAAGWLFRADVLEE
jgi:aquaporin Z